MRKRIIMLLAVCMFMILSTYITMRIYANGESKVTFSPNFLAQKSSRSIITPEDMKKDIDYLVETLKDVHPRTINGFDNNQKDAIRLAYEKINQQMTVGEFYFIANDVICALNDAHTNINYGFSKDDRFINMPFTWLNDGMYIKYDEDEFRKGDKIVLVGGKRDTELLGELEKITPSENMQWIKVMGGINLIKESYLKRLGLLKDDNVVVQVRRGEQTINIKLPLMEGDFSNLQDRINPPEYTIYKGESLGVFYLDSCTADKRYDIKLSEFFKQVSDNKIKNIAIDVRNNTGGDSKVIDKFLSYIDINKYTTFGSDKRLSSEAKQQRGYNLEEGHQEIPGEIVKNNKISDAEELFKGKVYVLTSQKTFSSANWFAVMIKDNKIGKVIGEPTGNAPSSYGDVLIFQMPCSGFRFQVSHKKWIRPDIKNDPEDSLHPDVNIYTTAEDLINGRDPQIEKLKEIVRQDI